jgi:hypothetical protein
MEMHCRHPTQSLSIDMQSVPQSLSTQSRSPQDVQSLSYTLDSVLQEDHVGGATARLESTWEDAVQPTAPPPKHCIATKRGRSLTSDRTCLDRTHATSRSTAVPQTLSGEARTTPCSALCRTSTYAVYRHGHWPNARDDDGARDNALGDTGEANAVERKDVRAAAHGHGRRQLGGREREQRAEHGDDREKGETAVKA